MRGIWLLSVTLTGSSFADTATVARIVFAFIFLGAISFGCWRFATREQNAWNGFEIIRYGVYFLLA